MRRKVVTFAIAAFLACSFPLGEAVAGEDKTAERLLTAAEGLQMPSSEADSSWHLVSYAGDGLPEAALFGEASGCPQGGMTRSDFDEMLGTLREVEPWMDAGQASSARGFCKLAKVFEHEFGEAKAVYRCDTGGPEIQVYFVGADQAGLVGLMTVSIET